MRSLTTRGSLLFIVIFWALQSCDSDEAPKQTRYLAERREADNSSSSHYIYTSFNKLLSLTNFEYNSEESRVKFMYFDGRLTDVELTRNNERVQTEISYDRYGLREKVVESTFVGESLQSERTFGFIFDTEGHIISRTEVSGADHAETRYTWENGNLVSEETTYQTPQGSVKGNRIEYKYNSGPNFTNQDEAFLYIGEGEWVLSRNFLTAIIVDGQSSPWLDRVTTYNQDGYPIEAVETKSSASKPDTILYRYE